jgi:phosphonate metabolism-associated iron-containing alcohol dehydrogenase
MNDWSCGSLLSTKNKAGGDPVESGSATAERPMWRFDNPVKILFGAGTLDQVAGIIGGRPYCLVTYDEPYFKTLSRQVAEGAGQPAVVIDTIRPNPDFNTLSEQCARFADLATPDCVILALGGGSVIDAAKVFASAGRGFEPVRRFLETKRGQRELSAFPVVAVPTTAGTGSEVTSWATVWDTQGQQKYSLARPELYPSHAVVDPSLMLGMSRELTINTGLDALSHALESIWNRNANAVSTNHAVFAASELLGTLPRLVGDLTNPALRARVARAALFAGLAFSNTKTALAHSVSYPITLKYDVPHGLACSFSLPMVMASVLGADEDCDHSLQRIFGDDLNAGVVRLKNFLADLDVSTNPVDYGVEGEEWRALIDAALAGQRGQNFIGTHARVMQCFVSTDSGSGVRSAL